MLGSQFILNADYAIFPAAMLNVEKELGMNDVELGFAGTITYIGLIASVMVSGSLLARNSKEVVQISMGLSAAFAIMCALAPTKHSLYLARFLAGMSHGPMYVYAPVWVDAFAPEGRETRWMTLVQVMALVANISFYAFTAAMVWTFELSWRYAFLLLGGSCAALTLLSLLVPAGLWTKEVDADFFADFLRVLPHPVFWLFAICPCMCFFTAIGVEYWGTKMLVHMGVLKYQAPYYFLIVGLGGPLLGMVLGALAMERLGGYRARLRASLFCVALCVFVVWPAAPFAMFPAGKTQLLFGTGFVMLAGAAQISVLQGLALDTLPAELRMHANSVFSVMCIGFGMQLPPVVVGMISHGAGVAQAWPFTMWPSVTIGPLCMMLATYLEYRASKQMRERWPPEASVEA
jgi:MFS family permease